MRACEVEFTCGLFGIDGIALLCFVSRQPDVWTFAEGELTEGQRVTRLEHALTVGHLVNIVHRC